VRYSFRSEEDVMPVQEVLVLAMTYMRSGICTAGFTQERDAVTHLRWVRPVKQHDTLRLADMTDAAGRVVQCDDVVEMDLKKPRPDPPHTEDWLADFIYHRPRLLRRLEGEQRACFLASHLDRAPQDVLTHHTRSLCLIRPDEVWAQFSLDAASGQYEARIGFHLAGLSHARAGSARGIPVTDLRWRALGRAWLGNSTLLTLGSRELAERLHAEHIYLALGLSRGFQGEHWLLVIGTHVVPDFEVTVDYGNL